MKKQLFPLYGFQVARTLSLFFIRCIMIVCLWVNSLAPSNWALEIHKDRKQRVASESLRWSKNFNSISIQLILNSRCECLKNTLYAPQKIGVYNFFERSDLAESNQRRVQGRGSNVFSPRIFIDFMTKSVIHSLSGFKSIRTKKRKINQVLPIVCNLSRFCPLKTAHFMKGFGLSFIN